MDFSQQESDIKRRRRLAEMLQETAGQSPQGQMVSGHYVAPNITQHLATLLSAYGSRKNAEKADTDESSLKKQRQDYASSLLGKPIGDSFQDKAVYFNELRNADPELAGAVSSALFKQGDSGSNPAAVEEYNFYSKLSPEDRKAYINVKRGGYSLEGQRFDPNNQVVVGSDVTAKSAMDVAAAKAQGKEIGKSQAQAAMSFPQDELNAQQTIALLGELSKHPGLSYAVGKSSLLPVIPGTDAADFNTRLDQLKGKQFLEAYDGLKGGGHITEVEGAKAEQAIARLNVAQTEDEFKNSVSELQEVIASGLERKRNKVGRISENQSDSGGIKFLGFE